MHLEHLCNLVYICRNSCCITEGYSKRWIRNAKRDRDLLGSDGCLSSIHMKHTVTVKDVNMALDIFGHEIPSFKLNLRKNGPFIK